MCKLAFKKIKHASYPTDSFTQFQSLKIRQLTVPHNNQGTQYFAQSQSRCQRPISKVFFIINISILVPQPAYSFALASCGIPCFSWANLQIPTQIWEAWPKTKATNGLGTKEQSKTRPTRFLDSTVTGIVKPWSKYTDPFFFHLINDGPAECKYFYGQPALFD